MGTDSLFARRLKEARDAAGVSQRQLGILAGIDEFVASARVNQYERGKHTPDYKTAERLAAVLGVPTAFFYAKDGDLAQLVRLYGLLGKRNRKRLMRQAHELAS